MPVVSQTGQTAQKAAQWLRWADQDYVAARILLLNGLIVQGCGLANTAIEKYLKTILVMRHMNISKGRDGHNVSILNDKLVGAGIDLALNKGFLEILVKAYRLRYPDDLEPGFNIVLEQTKIIAELDKTVHGIRKGFHLREKDGHRQMTLEALVEAKNDQLLDRNCVYGTASRRDLFAGPTQVYELRILPNGSILETGYETQGIADDGKFDAEALKPGQP